MEKDFKWYAVQVRGNKEKAAKTRLEKEIGLRGYQEDFKYLYIPMITNNDNKKRKESTSPLLKGVMFINCVLTRQVQGLILSQPDIFGFLGGKPNAIPSTQLTQMINESGCTDFDGNIIISNKFNVGDKVTIVSEEFKGFNGTITELGKNNTRAKVNIIILNKPIRAEFEISQLKKIGNK